MCFVRELVENMIHSFERIGGLSQFSEQPFDSVDRYKLYLSLPREHQRRNIALLADCMVTVDFIEKKHPFL